VPPFPAGGRRGERPEGPTGDAGCRGIAVAGANPDAPRLWDGDEPGPGSRGGGIWVGIQPDPGRGAADGPRPGRSVAGAVAGTGGVCRGSVARGSPMSRPAKT